MIDSISSDRKRNIDGQISLFASDDIYVPEIQYPNIREFDKKALLAMEKEMTGLYISGHPLDDYAQSLKLQTSNEIGKIFSHNEMLDDNLEISMPDDVIINNESGINDNDRVILGGILTQVNKKVTRNNTIMAFLQLEDLTGTIEVIVFPKTLDRVRELCNEDDLVLIKGRISLKTDELPKLICESIEPLEKINSTKVYLRVENTIKAKELSLSLKDLIKNYKGDTPIYIFATDQRQQFRVPRDRWIDVNEESLRVLRSFIGEENVKVIEL